jgi:hypothetical protein
MFNLSVKICQTLPLSKLTISAVAQIPNLRSFQITCHTFSVLLVVTGVCVCVDDLGSCHHLSHFPCFPKLVCTSQKHGWDIHSSPSVSVNNLKVSIADFLSLTRKLMLTHCLLSDQAQQHICTKTFVHCYWVKRTGWNLSHCECILRGQIPSVYFSPPTVCSQVTESVSFLCQTS